MENKVIHFSDGDFNREIVRREKPVLVDFWAEWCGPCKMIAPILDEISDEYAGRLIVGKLNVDHNPATATKYVIRSIPTLAIFKDGNLLKRQVGLFSKNQLKEFLDTTL